MTMAFAGGQQQGSVPHKMGKVGIHEVEDRLNHVKITESSDRTRHIGQSNFNRHFALHTTVYAA